MKTKFLFALVLSFACTLQLAAQDATSTSGIKSETLRAGRGNKPAPGQDYFINVDVKTQSGKEIFTTRDMNIRIHGVIGKDTDQESKAIYEVMKRDMQKGGKYRLEVPKDVMNNKKQAASLEGDYIVYEVELVDFADAKPSVADVIKDVISTQGVDAAKAKLDAIQSRNKSDYLFDEWDMNRAGYEMLEQQKTDEAITLFKMNTELHPNSWNAHDSLGDGYLAKEDKENAKAAFEQALKLNPEFKASREKLDSL